MAAGESDYEDTPSESVTIECSACDGDGWRYVSRAAMIGGRMQAVAKPEPCKVCQPADGGHPTGRVNLATGPGAKLRACDRVPVPGVDDWGPRRS